ncbi:MAG: endopeptidase La [candidate division WOR-3 bacterium]|nr:endopeptidase La [candidate division WOR-3 bacterium]
MSDNPETIVKLDEQPKLGQFPAELPVLVVKGGVVFPGLVSPLVVSTERSAKLVDDALAGDKLVCAVTQRDSALEHEAEPADLYEVGTIAVILKMLRFPDGTMRLLLQGMRRARVEEYVPNVPYLRAKIKPLEETSQKDVATRALMRSVADTFAKLSELAPYLPDDVTAVVTNIESPGRLADFAATYVNFDLSEKQHLLEMLDVKERLQALLPLLSKEIGILELGAKIRDQVKGELDKSQREYFLREQMKAIQKELGEVDQTQGEIDELRKKVEEAGMPQPALDAARRELDRLARMSPAASEYSVTRNYFDWLLAVPWKVRTEDSLDVRRAGKILNEDHYDLEKVKQRILEYLSVRKLKPDSKGPILCFVGPPGVGKTSLGRSIARALGRKFLRFSLGGIRDEAEIRGHRRTYVGALPGRVVQGLRTAGSMNPVFMLDEIDKVGTDFRGDPSSALLEVLDPEQNFSFSDHYLEVPVDLSQVMFITTANVVDTIIPALRDRMEILELPGYTDVEKVSIAKGFLVPRQLTQNGLTGKQVRFTDDALSLIVSDYTREAGVRNLEREVGSVMRKLARKFAEGRQAASVIDPAEVRRLLGPRRFSSEVAARSAHPGVSTGLAVTPFGGEIIFIESSLMKGKKELILTGLLGDVMKESAEAALSYVRSHATELGVNERFFEDADVHVHIPAGATPKDGPSAGIAIAASLLSLLRNEPLDPRVAMTGEITLTGRVLPIGGVKEKVLAASRAGIKTVILPAENRRDLRDVPANVRKGLTFHFVKSVGDLCRVLFPKTCARPQVRSAKPE